MSINIEKLIELLPQIAMLFLPGWIFTWVYRFISRRPYVKPAFSLEVVILSYVISLVTPFLVKFINNIFCSSLTIAPISLLGTAVTLGTILGFFRGNPLIEEWIGNSFGVRLEESVWEGIIDIKSGCYIRVFLENEKLVYKGAFRRYYSDGTETWIELQAYSVRNLSTKSYEVENEDEPLYSYKGQRQHMVVIKTKDIKRIEVLYGESSKKL